MVHVGHVQRGQAAGGAARNQQRDQLLWVGNQYKAAFGSYFHAMVPNRFPATLEELVEDRRGSVVRRHLRQVYINPFSGKADWQLVRNPQGGIYGISTRMNTVPDTALEFIYSPFGSGGDGGTRIP